MSDSSQIKDYYLINHDTGCQYMFKPYSHDVKVLINDGHGWRTYDDTMTAGNYMIDAARMFWDSLIRNNFTPIAMGISNNGKKTI